MCVQVWSHGDESVVDLPSPALFLRTTEDETLLFAGAFMHAIVWLSFLVNELLLKCASLMSINYIIN